MRRGQTGSRWIYVVVTVVLVLLALAACASPTTTTPAPKPTTAAPAPTTAAPKPTTAAPAPTTAAPAPAEQVIHWRVALTSAATGNVYEAKLFWPRELKKRTNGRLILDMYWGGILAGNKEMIEAVSQGYVDVGQITPGFDPGRLPLTQADGLPFLVDNRVDRRGLIMEQWMRKTPGLVDEWEKKNNIVLMVIQPFGAYEYFGKKPIAKLDDFKGLRIRVHNATIGDLLKKFGATPVTIQWSEMYSALQTGLIDGILYPPANTPVLKISEVTQYYTKNIAVTAANETMMINRDAWNKLPQDIKALWPQFTYDYYKWMYDFVENDQVFVAELAKWKGQTMTLPDAEHKKLMDLAQPIWDDWSQKTPGGKEALASYISIRDQIVKQYPNGLK